MNKPNPNEIYRHFKGNLYQVITLAMHTETGEEMVVYRALYGEQKVFVRPLAMFVSEVDREKYPDVAQKYRFERIEELGAQKPVLEKEKQAGAEPPVAEKVQQEKPATQPVEEKMDVREQAAENDELPLDPLVLEFLDADTYENRLNILAALHHRIDNDMINTMAMAIDVEVPDGEIEERFVQLQNCLLTLDKYECNRMR